MAIELIREAFKVEELKGNEEIQVLVETELYLTSGKPDIENLLWIKGKVDILNTRIIEDKLLVNGITKFNVVYQGGEEEDNIYTVDTTKDFKEEILIEGINEGMSAGVKSNIEFIESELGESKVNLRAVINLQAIVEEVKTVEIIKEINGKAELQTLTQRVGYKEVYGSESSYIEVMDTIKVDMDKPNIEKVLKFSVIPKEIESMVVEDRIILSGDATVNMIYYGEGQISSLKEIIPFNHFIEIPGAMREGKKHVELEVIEGLYEVMEDELGELKIVEIDIKILATGKAYEEKFKELIVDAYSTKENILLERESISLVENIEEFWNKELVTIEIENIDTKEIYDIEATANIMDKTFSDDEVIIEGIISLGVYYLDRISDEPQFYSGEFPYKSNIKVGLLEDNVRLELEHKLDYINYDLRKDGICVLCNVDHHLSINKERTVYGIKEIIETGEIINKKDKPSIIIYIVQKGDILWDIAKRYNTTMEEILLSNKILNADDIKVGDKIIIEKRIDFSL